MRALLAALLLWANTAHAQFFPAAPTEPLVASLDYQDLTGGNNALWYHNNVYGNTGYKNGVDYTQSGKGNTGQMGFTGLTNFFMQWSWPNTGATFEFGYPELVYGRSMGTQGAMNPFGKTGPWPKVISTFTTLSTTYSVTLTGNLQSYDVLLDLYATTVANPTDFSTLSAEISFYPFIYLPVAPTGTCHQFSNFWAEIVSATGGTGKPQILITPTSASCAAYQPLSTTGTTYTIDLKEILLYCVAQGFMPSTDYIQGVEFGGEPQTQMQPHATLPHQGSFMVNSLSYVWN